MAEDRQPPTVVEGATVVGGAVGGAGAGPGDVEDNEPPPAAKSAEDRKAAAALSKLDARGDDDEAEAGAGAARGVVDQEAVSRAMNSLGSGLGGAGANKKDAEKKDVKKVKVEPADVALLVDELELSKAKATELLRAHDGDAVQAIRAFITPAW